MFWPEPTTTIAPASGEPLSAPVTRPETRIADCTGRVARFGPSLASVWTTQGLAGEAQALDLQADSHAATDAREPEPALGVADDGTGPYVIQELEGALQEVDPVITTLVFLRDADARSADCHARGRSSLEVDEPSFDELLGPQPHVGRG